MTDVYMQPAAPAAAPDREMLELAAFERGRAQGETEALRRMEAERVGTQKQLLEPVPAAQTNLQRPDVVEINRLTNWQRLSFVLGEGACIAMLVLTIVWLDVYRGDFGWDTNNADAIGYIDMWNSTMLAQVLGLFCLGQAITNYRALPINMTPGFNRFWYCLMQCCAVTAFSVAMAGYSMTQPDVSFWSAADWVFACAFAVSVSHSVFSMLVTLGFACAPPRAHKNEAGANPNGVDSWNESAGERAKLEWTPEQRRDHSGYNQYGRTLYAPAPVNVHSTGPAANANVGAEVPVAPANAPRWAEMPRTHAEDYWLLPRAKWATVGFWSMGVALLMELAHYEAVLATGQATGWAQQDSIPRTNMDETGRVATIIGCLGLMTLLTLAFLSYVAMPPRTTLVKNGVLQDNVQARRTSLSTTETHVQQNVV